MSSNQQIHNERLTGFGMVDAEGSSLPSKRFDIAPLCQVVEDPGRCADSDTGPGTGVAPMYIEAFPLPGLTAGIRFTTTEDERGMICESSLSSTKFSESIPARTKQHTLL